MCAIFATQSQKEAEKFNFENRRVQEHTIGSFNERYFWENACINNFIINDIDDYGRRDSFLMAVAAIVRRLHRQNNPIPVIVLHNEQPIEEALINAAQNRTVCSVMPVSPRFRSYDPVSGMNEYDFSSFFSKLAERRGDQNPGAISAYAKAVHVVLSISDQVDLAGLQSITEMTQEEIVNHAFGYVAENLINEFRGDNSRANTSSFNALAGNIIKACGEISAPEERERRFSLARTELNRLRIYCLNLASSDHGLMNYIIADELSRLAIRTSFYLILCDIPLVESDPLFDVLRSFRTSRSQRVGICSGDAAAWAGSDYEELLDGCPTMLVRYRRQATAENTLMELLKRFGTFDKLIASDKWHLLPPLFGEKTPPGFIHMTSPRVDISDIERLPVAARGLQDGWIHLYYV